MVKKRCSRLSQLIIAFGNVLLIVFGAGAENRVRQRHFTSGLIFLFVSAHLEDTCPLGNRQIYRTLLQLGVQITAKVT